MNRGLRRFEIFLDPAGDRAEFLELVGQLRRRFGVVVLAYAMMPNHYHLLVVSLHGRLSEAMAWLQARYVQRLNQRSDWDGPLFRGRFRNRLVLDPGYWAHLFFYIHTNPARAGYAPAATRSWTSRWAWTDGRHPDWLDVSGLVDAFGSVDAYLRYEAEQLGSPHAPDGWDPEALWVPYETGVIGRIAARPTPEEAKAMVRPFLPLITDLDHLDQRAEPSRWLETWWLWRGSELSQLEIGELLNISQQTVNHRVRRIERLRRSNRQIGRWTRALERRLAIPSV